MKAMVWTKYGPPDVLQLKEVAKPAPKEHEVLVRIHATTVTAGDCELRSLKLPLALRLPIRLFLGLRKPRIAILGQELSGEIEATGKHVTRFKVGDQIFAWTGIRLGAYAEYICLPENGVLAIKPPNITYEEAAVLPVGGLEAAHFMRQAGIRRGQRVLINGAGGSIGTFAVQIARHLGAEVTAVDSADKLDMLRSIGASHLIDYKRQDFARGGATYDVIFDVIGKSSFSSSIRALRQNGRYLLGNPPLSHRLRAPWISRRSSKKVTYWATRTPGEITEDMTYLTQLLEAGKIKSVIDKCYPLEQTAQAHSYVEAGHKKGNVVITVAPSSNPL